jgi:site-specific DNA recombinase
MNDNQTPGKYKAKTSYLLTGKIICGKCGYKYQGNSRTSRRSTNIYTSYRCGNRGQTNTCENTEIERTKLEKFVIKELKKNLFNAATLSTLVDELNTYRQNQNKSADSDMSNLKKRLVSINKEIENFINAISSGVNAVSIKDKLMALESEKRL